MSTTTKKATTCYGVDNLDEQRCSSKLDCTTEKNYSNQPTIKDDKEDSEHTMTRNLCCLEGFVFRKHE